MALAQVLIDLYVMIVVADCVLSHLPEHRHRPWAVWIRRMSAHSCGPVRRLLGRHVHAAPFDPSPLLVIVLLQVLGGLL